MCAFVHIRRFDLSSDHLLCDARKFQQTREKWSAINMEASTPHTTHAPVTTRAQRHAILIVVYYGLLAGCRMSTICLTNTDAHTHTRTRPVHLCEWIRLDLCGSGPPSPSTAPPPLPKSQSIIILCVSVAVCLCECVRSVFIAR